MSSAGPDTAPPAADAVSALAPAPDGSVVLQYPSRDFPPPPVFRLRVPEGWLAVPVPEAQMAVRRPEPVEGFHPNVLVRVRRTPARATVADDLRRLTAIDDAPEGMEVLADEVRTDLATPARSLKVRFAGPEGLTLEARHLMVYVPATEHVANVVSVVGTWPHTDDPALGLEVETAVASLRLLLPAG